MSTKLMAHMVAGYPDLKTSIEIGKALVDAGANYLEVQIPFSDPIADGETIQMACGQSIKNGIKVADCLDLAAQLVGGGTDIILMSYFNPIFQYGADNFFEEAEKKGVKKFIVPDLPVTEQYYNQHEIIPVISPMVNAEKIKMLKFKSPIIYCTAGYGITGKSTAADTNLEKYFANIRTSTQKQIAVGFGIKSVKQVYQFKNLCEIIIIGSQFIREYDKGGLHGLSSFATEIKKAL